MVCWGRRVNWTYILFKSECGRKPENSCKRARKILWTLVRVFFFSLHRDRREALVVQTRFLWRGKTHTHTHDADARSKNRRPMHLASAPWRHFDFFNTFFIYKRGRRTNIAPLLCTHSAHEDFTCVFVLLLLSCCQTKTEQILPRERIFLAEPFVQVDH